MAEIPVFSSASVDERLLPPPPDAYSYVRFSTQKQHLGDSLRRQVQLGEDYAREHGLHLSPHSYRDLGVSGFGQKNIKTGALSAFINAVKNGYVKPGSFLLIEHFDRLSRAEVRIAFRLLLDLVEAGITVVTLVDERVWNSESVDDIANLITSIILMSRAHEESKSKQKRLRSAWGQRKDKAALFDDTGPNKGKRNVVTAECPRWLKVNDTRDGFIVLEDRAESVRKIFAARIGGFGISSIVTRANSERWPVPGKSPLQRANEDDQSFGTRKGQGLTWHTSLVGRLLKNRAVLGEYQPFKTEYVKVKGEADKKVRNPAGDPVLNYYPPIIDEKTFLRAQAKTERSGRFPGRRDASLKNWLQGILRCTCGQSFVRKNYSSKAQPGYARYHCTARNRSVPGCVCPSASAEELEHAVLAVVTFHAPTFNQGTARPETLKARVDLLEVELSAAKETRDRFALAIGISKAPVSSLLGLLDEAEEKVEALELAIGAARAELADLSDDYESVFENILTSVRSVDSLDARAALRENLSRVIEKVVVHQAEGFIRVFLRGDNVPVTHGLGESGKHPVIGVELRQAEPFAQRLPEGFALSAQFTPEEEAAHLEQLEKDEESEK
jgi:DNA invertase Pin-like site-specific DNA recombinase